MRLSPHTAQAFTNAPRRTRLDPSATLAARVSVGGSWRAATPGCPTCPDHPDSARPGGAGARAALLPAAAARTPHTAPAAPSTDTQSVLYLQASAKASRPALPPGT